MEKTTAEKTDYQDRLHQAVKDMESERTRCDMLANRISQMETETARLRKEIEDLQTQVDDLHGEKLILIKKCQNEVRELKNVLAKDKSSYAVLLKDKNQLEKDYRVVMEKLRHEATSSLNHTPDGDGKTSKAPSTSSRQEKIILEALSNRVNELEVYTQSILLSYFLPFRLRTIDIFRRSKLLNSKWTKRRNP